jgi:hypothetical protein
MPSIWLQPLARQQEALQSVIAELADEHRTVWFRPHLTVCQVAGDPTALDRAVEYVRACGLLPLKAVRTGVTGAVITPFRAVFIEIENSPELNEFRERLRDILSAPPLIPPHISLLYTLDKDSEEHRPDLDAAVLASTAARCANAIKDEHFTLGNPVVNSAGGSFKGVRNWTALRPL